MDNQALVVPSAEAGTKLTKELFTSLDDTFHATVNSEQRRSSSHDQGSNNSTQEVLLQSWLDQSYAIWMLCSLQSSVTQNTEIYSWLYR